MLVGKTGEGSDSAHNKFHDIRSDDVLNSDSNLKNDWRKCYEVGPLQPLKNNFFITLKQ